MKVSRQTVSGSGPVGFYMNIAWVLAFCALVVLILNPIFGSLAALVFLASGMVLIASQLRHSVYVSLRYWFILCLPAYCLLSTLWSQYPLATLRFALQFAITCVIAVVIANRVPPLALQRILFAIYGVGVFSSLAFGRVRDDIGAWVGIFGSKNAFAGVVSVFILACLAVLFDRGAHWLTRFLALASLLVSAPLLLLAQSAGAVIVLIPAIGIALLIQFGSLLNPLQRVFFFMLIVMIGAAAAWLASAYADMLFAMLLETSGKDTSLTGRTDLWQIGFDIISRHPLLGVGYQAFWVEGNPLAEALWAEFGITTRQGFNFHNTYISNGVEIGILGVSLQVAILYGALLGNLLWAFRNPSPANAFFSSFLVMVTGSSFAEVAVFFQFSVTSILVICALVYAVQANAAWKAQVAPATSGSNPMRITLAAPEANEASKATETKLSSTGEAGMKT